jgi:hypothetical protein
MMSPTGAGAAVITNSIRASIIVEPVPGKENFGTYRFIGAKRGSRCGAGWTRGESGCYERFFKHTSEPGLLMWEDADPVAKEEKPTKNLNKLMDDIFELIPKDRQKGKIDIEVYARQTLKVGANQVQKCLQALQERGLIFSWTLPKQTGGRGAPPTGWCQREQPPEDHSPKKTSRTKK